MKSLIRNKGPLRKANLTDLEEFQNTILDQPIWGNRFISSIPFIYIGID